MNHRYSKRQNAALEKTLQVLFHHREYSKITPLIVAEKLAVSEGISLSEAMDALESAYETSISNMEERV